MIASPSPALKSSPMIQSSYHVESVSVSPGASSHTEASLSPNNMQNHSPIAMVTRTSPGTDEACNNLLRNVKVQNVLDISSALSMTNSSLNELPQSQIYTAQNQTVPSSVYLPLHYNGSIREIVKNEQLLEQNIDPHGMSYQPLQVVTSETVLAHQQDRNGLFSANQNSMFQSLPFLPGVTTQNTPGIDQANNTISVNGGLAQSAAPYNDTRMVYLQMENGNYQAVSLPAGTPSNCAVAPTSQHGSNITMSQGYVESNQALTTHDKNNLQQESKKEKTTTGPYRTSKSYSLN